jgi:hypothetical protein
MKLTEKKAANLDNLININVLIQFAASLGFVFNTTRRSKVLYMQELYIEHINENRNN